MNYRNNQPRFTVLALLLALVLFGNLSVASAQQATFTTGTVYSSTFNFLTGEGGIGVVPSAGGAVSNTFSLPGPALQIAWSPDLTSAYAMAGAVFKLTPDGAATLFASPPSAAFAVGTHPDGRVLVALLNGAQVFDVSAGGEGPFPVYATVPNFDPFHDQNYALLRTSAGRLLISGSYHQIYDITDPANITVVADASGLPGNPDHFYDMAEGPSGEIYAFSPDGPSVIKVAGGIPSIFAAIPFFDFGNSVTYGYGKLFVGGATSGLPFTRVIYDISAGGNFPTAPAPFATHGDLALGQTILDTVPAVYPPSPQSQIDALIAQLEALITGGTLTQNQGNALINKLNQVSAKLDSSQTGAACNQLGAFVNQVNAFVNSGSLTQAQGQALIDAANAIKTNLGC